MVENGKKTLPAQRKTKNMGPHLIHVEVFTESEIFNWLADQEREHSQVSVRFLRMGGHNVFQSGESSTVLQFRVHVNFRADRASMSRDREPQNNLKSI